MRRKALISLLQGIEIEIVNGKGHISNKSCEDINDFIQIEARRETEHRHYIENRNKRISNTKQWKEKNR